MTYDFIVIGAGLSGITSALILAGQGLRVALVEKSRQTAPLLRGFFRRGVHFDTGFHYTGGLGNGEPLDVFFRHLGLRDRLEIFPFRPESFDVFRCRETGLEFRFPLGYPRLRESLVASFPGEEAAIDRYLQMVEGVCASMPYLNLDANLGSVNALEGVHGPTLAEILDSLTANSLLKDLLATHTLLYGVHPGEVPFSHHARIVGNYYRSAAGIRGGGLALANVCDSRLRELGIDVYCGAEVIELLTLTGGKMAGVALKDGRHLNASGCIATVHPQTLLDIVPEHLFRPSYRKRLAALEETVSAIIAFGVSPSPLPFLNGTNLFLRPGGEPVPGTASLDRSPMYVTAAYRGGEQDAHGFIAIMPADFQQVDQWEHSVLGNRPEGYLAYKKDLKEKIEQHLMRLCPELQGAECVDFATPLTMRHYTANPKGGLYGVKHRVGQYNPLPATRIGGLYLAGQAVIAPGILGAVLSGYVACGTVLGHDRLRKELRACS